MIQLSHLPLLVLFFISAASSAGCALSAPGGYTETDESPAHISDGEEMPSCFVEDAEGAIALTPCPASSDANSHEIH